MTTSFRDSLVNEVKKILGIDILQADETVEKKAISDLHTQVMDLISQVLELQDKKVSIPSGAESYYIPETSLTRYLEKNPIDPNYTLLKSKIVSQPTFVWFNGDESSDNQNSAVVSKVQDLLKKANGNVLGISLYAIPGRDAGGPSAGGVRDVASYMAYVGAIGYAIQQADNPRVDFIIETDALGLNLPDAYTCINGSVDILKKNFNTKVFLTASEWIDAQDMAQRLIGAGVTRSNGVAVNISGRMIFPDVEVYVKKVLSYIPDMELQYLIDTSRNGVKVDDSGTNGWENTSGSKLGVPPQIFNQGQKYAYAWVKPPSESDGNLNGAPNAGELYYSYAVKLAQ